jgi:ParB family transcriptional regulator, chromosome partitioning protein
MNKPETRKALGKGLGALVPTRPLAAATPPPPSAPPERQETALEVAIELIEPNPLQARKIFTSDRLEELAQSIRANGIIQPLVVRKAGEKYQLVAGERRWRAAKIAGISIVPIVIREIADERLLEITLIENIQREDLTPIETAAAFNRMSTDLSLSAEQIGLRTGKDRSTVVNFIRLLNLPEAIQQMISDRKLSAGHGRCLLSITDPALQVQLAEHAAAQNLSVRQTERMSQRMMEGRQPKKVEEVKEDPNVRAAIQEMERVLGTKVKIVERAKGKGRIEIEYYSADDLDRLYGLIVQE